MATTIVDPVARIEGHLKVKLVIESGVITDVEMTGNMYRGFETFLVGQLPIDAPLITQRVCGVCPTAHADASVHAIEEAAKVQAPPNGMLMRNIIHGAEYLHSHLLHSYHLALQDYVDMTGAVGGVGPWAPLYGGDRRIAGTDLTNLVGSYVERQGRRAGRQDPAHRRGQPVHPRSGGERGQQGHRQDKVKYIIGEVCSKASIPISEIANSKGVVQISPTSTHPDVTVDAAKKTKAYIFRACFIDPFQGLVMAKFAHGEGYRTAFIMYDQGNDYTVGLANAFEEKFKSLNGAIVGKETYTKTDTDFSAILAKIKDTKPEVVMLPDYYNVVNRSARDSSRVISPALGIIPPAGQR